MLARVSIEHGLSTASPHVLFLHHLHLLKLLHMLLVLRKTHHLRLLLLLLLRHRRALPEALPCHLLLPNAGGARQDRPLRERQAEMRVRERAARPLRTEAGEVMRTDLLAHMPIPASWPVLAEASLIPLALLCTVLLACM